MTLQIHGLRSFELGPTDVAAGAAAATGGVGTATFLLAGAVAVATLKGWISRTSWSGAEYNLWMRTMNDTIGQWDTLGWKLGCWQKYPDMRKNWLQYWSRFSKQWKEHPSVDPGALITWATESEEAPARILMTELSDWGSWFNAHCGAQLDIKPLSDEEAATIAKANSIQSTDWTSLVKWGALAIGGVVALNLISSIRGAFSHRA